MNTNTIKLSGKFLIVNGKRIGIRVSVGPWIDSVNPDLIKVRLAKSISFPQEVRETFAVSNNSDSREDYFEKDCLRLLPGHALYEAAKALGEC